MHYLIFVHMLYDDYYKFKISVIGIIVRVDIFLYRFSHRFACNNVHIYVRSSSLLEAR